MPTHASDTPAGWATTQVSSRLGIRYPIVQGPFGGGLSSPQLAATVSNAGGLGSFGAHQLAPEAIPEVADQIKSLTPHPFAMNLWVSVYDADESSMTRERFDSYLTRLVPYYEELGVELPAYPERFAHSFEDQAQALLAAAPPVFSFIFGVPSAAVLDECRARDIVTIGTATTPDEAVALDRAGVDLIVVSGLEAGGHRASFIRSAEQSLTGGIALIPVVADEVRAPLIAAGGIADARGVVAALALGAAGVQIGTAFLATEESAAAPEHRELLLGRESRETTLTRVYTGRLARGIPNRLLEELSGDLDAIAPYPFQGWFLKHLRPAVVSAGRTDLVALWAGQAAPLVRHRHAAELMAALVAETDAAFTALASKAPAAT